MQRTLRQKTFMARIQEKGQSWDRNWYLIDAQGKTLGRLATELSRRLQGKHKPIYTPHVDVGDYLVVINTTKIKLTGNKREQKQYYHYSGYPGGMRARNYNDYLAVHPTGPLYQAVRLMLPKTTLGRRMLKKLKLYPGPDHSHQAQHPEPLEL